MARRTVRIEIRLTKQEAERLNTDVAKAGLSREAYLRALIRENPIKEQPPMDLVDTLKSLQQIGNNMNQIAVKANANGFIDTAAYWENVRWLQQTISELLEAMY